MSAYFEAHGSPGNICWGDHVSTDDFDGKPLNFLEVATHGGSIFCFALEDVLRGLMTLPLDRPATCNIERVRWCCEFRPHQIGPRTEQLEGALRWHPAEAVAFRLVELGLARRQFAAFIEWLAGLPVWKNDAIRPLELTGQERETFREFHQRVQQLAA